ncbi:MAG: hypothetical protein UR26_C0010G0011 [candidate division TM6 bacterium GW2011_GWF2_32_72]|nr:MAG: hypothetical protein UR26_C0010G0011 [candidate division TM6 bacterium GW2011_GWF2_32_72]
MKQKSKIMNIGMAYSIKINFIKTYHVKKESIPEAILNPFLQGIIMKKQILTVTMIASLLSTPCQIKADSYFKHKAKQTAYSAASPIIEDGIYWAAGAAKKHLYDDRFSDETKGKIETTAGYTVAGTVLIAAIGALGYVGYKGYKKVEIITGHNRFIKNAKNHFSGGLNCLCFNSAYALKREVLNQEGHNRTPFLNYKNNLDSTISKLTWITWTNIVSGATRKEAVELREQLKQLRSEIILTNEFKQEHLLAHPYEVYIY